MQAVFRVDASLLMGTGHIMRCLTLAGALRELGWSCRFICREHAGHLIDEIIGQGFKVLVLPGGGKGEAKIYPTHAVWLGASQADDATACQILLAGEVVDWLVVDHYALERSWEEAMLPYCRRLLVIDDLADRFHSCNILLDQNLGRQEEDYSGLVPASCRLLLGCEFALLRAEFSLWREDSLRRRRSGRLQRLLITLGGGDKDNFTGAVLRALRDCPLPRDCFIDVVLGAQSPWLAEVCAEARKLPWQITVEQGVGDMAHRMAIADLAIGAAGSTSWERCCLGLPTLLLVIAENQYPAATALHESGAAILLPASELPHALLESLAILQASPARLAWMGLLAAGICSGAGVSCLIKKLLEALP